MATVFYPHTRRIADIHMKNKLKHLKLDDLFDEISTARPYPWGKGKAMIGILRKKGIPKSKALLVGDSYLYDYQSAKTFEIDCLLLTTPYTRYPVGTKKPLQTITHLQELLTKLKVVR